MSLRRYLAWKTNSFTFGAVRVDVGARQREKMNIKAETDRNSVRERV